MAVLPPDLDGNNDGGVSPPAGGGTPGTETGSSLGPAIPAGENGGVFGSTFYLLTPVEDIASGRCYLGYYDPASFNDTMDGSSYTYRSEDIIKDCVATVNRVVLTYRDLGAAKITVSISGTNDNSQVVSASVQVQLGNQVATGALLTRFVDIQLTCFRPQLSLSRAAGAGPVCITGATMRGTVSEVEQY